MLTFKEYEFAEENYANSFLYLLEIHKNTSIIKTNAIQVKILNLATQKYTEMRINIQNRAKNVKMALDLVIIRNTTTF